MKFHFLFWRKDQKRCLKSFSCCLIAFVDGDGQEIDADTCFNYSTPVLIWGQAFCGGVILIFVGKMPTP